MAAAVGGGSSTGPASGGELGGSAVGAAAVDVDELLVDELGVEVAAAGLEVDAELLVDVGVRTPFATAAAAKAFGERGALELLVELVDVGVDQVLEDLDAAAGGGLASRTGAELLVDELGADSVRSTTRAG